MKNENAQNPEHKKSFGDRRDGWLIKGLDPLHIVMPYMYPGRCNNEAFIQERIDLSAIDKYLEDKNSSNPEFKYKLFQLLVSAVVKTMVLRPKMNRFIQGKKMFLRKELSVSFIIKKQFKDEGKEAIAFIKFDENDTLETVRDKMYKEITSGRSDKMDGATQSLSLVSKIPRFIIRLAVNFLNWLDFHGKFPKSMAATDPNYASVFLTNLGSIGLEAGYHHLTDRGTNSVFIVIGKAYKAPEFHEDGTFTMKNFVDIGITLDERIADGYYYAKTIKLLKYLLSNPELLETPAKEEVPYDVK